MLAAAGLFSGHALAQDAAPVQDAAEEPAAAESPDPALAAELEALVKDAIVSDWPYNEKRQIVDFAMAHPEFAKDAITGFVRVLNNAPSIDNWYTAVEGMADIGAVYPEHVKQIYENIFEPYTYLVSLLESENPTLQEQAARTMRVIATRLPGFQDDAARRLTEKLLREGEQGYSRIARVLHEEIIYLGRDAALGKMIVSMLEQGLDSDIPEVVGLTAEAIGLLSNSDDDMARHALGLFEPLVMTRYKELEDATIYDGNDGLGNVLDAIGYIGQGETALSPEAMDLLARFAMFPDIDHDHARSAMFDIAQSGIQREEFQGQAVAHLQAIGAMPERALMASRYIDEIARYNDVDLRDEATRILQRLIDENDDQAFAAAIELAVSHADTPDHAREVLDVIQNMVAQDPALLQQYDYYRQRKLMNATVSLGERHPQHAGKVMEMIRPLAHQYVDEGNGAGLKAIADHIEKLTKAQQAYLAANPPAPVVPAVPGP